MRNPLKTVNAVLLEQLHHYGEVDQRTKTPIQVRRPQPKKSCNDLLNPGPAGRCRYNLQRKPGMRPGSYLCNRNSRSASGTLSTTNPRL
jgi:hypothetical protein